MKVLNINKMSLSERLHAMELLWDSLQNENGQIQSPEWHENILTERLQKIKDGSAKFIKLKDLNKTLSR